MNSWLSRISYKYRDKGIKNLMYYIVGGMFILYACTYFEELYIVPQYFEFSRDLILQGQIWRIISFIFIPDYGSMLILFLISAYFYTFIANTLEKEWGTIRFNIYYFTGVLGCIIAGFITGYASNTYLNLSLFLAFAALYPDFQILLFFIIPIKMKYIAIVDLAIYGISLFFALITFNWATVAEILFSLANLILFFGGDYFNRIKNSIKSKARKAEWERNTRNFRNPY